MTNEPQNKSGHPARGLADQLSFLRQWAGRPLRTGAVSPSGRALARRMAAGLDPADPDLVVELGPGTGPVTQAILDHGVAPEKLATIEFNGDFARLLAARFPKVDVIEGDAFTLTETLGERARSPLAAIVSSLPLFTSPPELRRTLLLQGLALLKPGAPFIQFSYALVPPVAEEKELFTLEVSPWIVLNMPPARVWTYRRAA